MNCTLLTLALASILAPGDRVALSLATAITTVLTVLSHNITVVVFANRSYAVLKREFSSLGIGEPGPRASSMFDIGNPDLDWTQLSKSMGVPGTRPTSMKSFVSALSAAFAEEGPALIEIDL